MSPPSDLDSLSAADLKSLVLKLLEEMAELRRTISAQREEIAQLKGVSGRPKIKPSGMDRATDPRPAPTIKSERTIKGNKGCKLVVDEERTIKVTAPPGSRFKGYATFVVQDLVIHRHVVSFRRERWQVPNGAIVTAPLPPGIRGHFGAELRRLVLAQYHQCQITIPQLLVFLRSLGIIISKRQIVRLLIADQNAFIDEARDVLRAGLSTAAWITVDDTAARHKGVNGFCTQIGNADFCWFGTTQSKSRSNFLQLLHAGHGDYVINAEALSYMVRYGLPKPILSRLEQHPDRMFADRAAWTAHLQKLAISDHKVNSDAGLATDGALWGSIKAHGLLPNTVIISDDAGQFNVGLHGLCWVHTERMIHSLDTFTDEHRAAQSRMRSLVWRYYRALKRYRQKPSASRKVVLEQRFERIFTHRTGFVTLDRLLARLYARKHELLRVLERPEIPLHTNGSENDIRSLVTKRKVSGGTRSDTGRDCRDAFSGLSKTCKKLAISFWDFLGARLAVPTASNIPYLPELVTSRARPP